MGDKVMDITDKVAAKPSLMPPCFSDWPSKKVLRGQVAGHKLGELKPS